MSISNLEDSNIRLVTLGQGSTGISQVMVNGDTVSSGIAFSNTLDGVVLSENGVIIEITNGKGVYAYIRAIIDLLKTWNLDDTTISNILDELSRDLTKEIEK